MKKSGSKTSPQLGSHRFTRPVRPPGKLPNYMKSTISADSRRARPKVSTKRQSPRTSPDNSSLHRKDSTNSTNNCLISRQEERALVRKGTCDALSGNLEVARATCSSTLKGSAFPNHVELNPGGTGLQGDSGLKVCPYSYCSFHGHLRAVLPPLKCFISARGRALKAKRSVKLRCQSPKTREEPATSNGEEGVNGGEILNGDQTRFFDEIYGDEVSQESYDEEGLSTDSQFTSDNWESVGLSKPLPDENVGNRASGPVEETTASVDGTECKAIKHDKGWVDYECNRAENFNGASTINEPYLRDSELNLAEGERIVVHESNSRNTATPENEGKSFKHEKSSQECDDPRHFNLCGLHLLPLEPDPEAEKVNLRHQEVDARKNAEEWMVDYALRQEVTKGSTASQRKVALLVEAFERVLPTSKH